eukprot:scaffold65038_cov65-Phaeocystis_antarctica.AAC.2
MAHPGGGRELPMKLAVPPFDARDRSVLAALPFRVLFRCRRIIGNTRGSCARLLAFQAILADEVDVENEDSRGRY